jgi:twitching motility protein PilT
MAHEMDASMADVPILAWLAEAVERGASDLHLLDAHPPMLRLHGQLRPIEAPRLNDEDIRGALRKICPPAEYDRFLALKNLDFAFECLLSGTPRRLRANFFLSGATVGACLRIIASEIPDFQWSGFPAELAGRLAHFRNGLVLFSGVAGSGKSTSLAMIIQLLNHEGGYRIITIEDPIEYVFPRVSNSVITQREVGRDVRTFADGLKYGLRQDPDVFLVGEIRDRATAQLALSAAETGHLVFSTLHARDAKGAISRFTDLFPQSAQYEVRAQLALSLRAIVCQHLLPGVIEGEKRELALEVLFNTTPVASSVRSGRLENIDNSILTGRADGMVPLAESIKRLLIEGRIYADVAERFAGDAMSVKKR